RSLRWHSAHRPTTRGRRPRWSFNPQLTLLEDRTVPSTFTVTNLLDNGSVGSLHWAVGQANTTAGADKSKFAVTGTIPLPAANGPPNVPDDLTIDGPGANKVTVSGGGGTRVFHASGAATDLTIDGLTIANGHASPPLGGDTALGGALLNDG